ncbi:MULTISPECIES: hypothetical protein [Streptomyces]|uniref:hypothetical protein n=1 Tax=Streptomyces TaxID=1883 RepID=UPI00364ABF4B
MRHRCARFHEIYDDYSGAARKEETYAGQRSNLGQAKTLRASAFNTRRTMARRLETHIRHCGLCG